MKRKIQNIYYKSKIESIFNEKQVKINKLFIKQGDIIEKNDIIGILKYGNEEKEIKSPYNGIVEKVYLKENETYLISSPFYDLLLGKDYYKKIDPNITIFKIFSSLFSFLFIVFYFLYNLEISNKKKSNQF